MNDLPSLSEDFRRMVAELRERYCGSPVKVYEPPTVMIPPIVFIHRDGMNPDGTPIYFEVPFDTTNPDPAA